MQSNSVWTKRLNPIRLLAFAGYFLFAGLALNGVHPGLTNDSIAYFSAAQNFAAGNGLTLFTGKPMVEWPPLYPILMSVVSEDRGNFLMYAFMLNGFCFAAVVLLLGALLRKMKINLIWQFFAALVIVTSFNVFEIFTMAWTEPLFSCLLLAWLLCLVFATNERPNLKKTALLATVTALACLTRYAGVILVLVGMLCLWFYGTNLKSRLKQVVLFSAISLLPLIIWMTRNYLITESITGSRGYMWRPFTHYVWRFLDIFTGWFLPMTIPWEIRTGIVFIVLGMLIVSAFGLLKKGEGNQSFKASFRSSNGTSRVVFVSGIFTICYILFILISGRLGYSGDASERFLSPLFFPVLICGLHLLQKFQQNLKSAWQKNAFLGLCFVWLAYPGFRQFNHAKDYYENGRGPFVESKWADSETLRRVYGQKPELPIYSSLHAGVFWFTQLNCRETAHKSRSIREFRDDLPDQSILVWFDDYKGFYHYDISELESVVNLTLQKNTSDGSIFLMEPK